MALRARPPRVFGGAFVLLFVALSVPALATEIPPPLLLEWGSYGSAHGQFRSPRGLDTDEAGNVYVADTYNYRVEKFDGFGNYLATFQPIKPDPPLTNPVDVAVGPNGDVYVLDTGGPRVVRFDAAGNYLGSWGTLGDLPGNFDDPNGLDVDADGNVYVADTGNARVQKFSGTGEFLFAWGTPHCSPPCKVGDPSCPEPVGGEFCSLRDVAVDPDGTILTHDRQKEASRVQRFDATGRFLSSWDIRDLQDGAGLCADAEGNVYLTGHMNQVFKYDGAGNPLCSWGVGEGRIGVTGVTVDPTGAVFVTTTTCCVQRYGTICIPTPAGLNVSVSLPDPKTLQPLVTLTFDEVVEAGCTTLNLGVGAPSPYLFYETYGYSWFDISTTAHYLGGVQVCVHYSDKWIKGADETLLELFHEEGDIWVVSTSGLDTGADLICARTTPLGMYGLFYPVKPNVGFRGDVVAECNDDLMPLMGVTIDVYEQKTGDMVGIAVTDSTGYFLIPDLPQTGYTVTLVTPLGYTCEQEEFDFPKPKPGVNKIIYYVDCPEIAPDPRSMGYWKHQVGAILSGKNNGQVPAEDLCGYLDLIQQHFNDNTVNPVAVYQPPSWGGCTEKLEVTGDLLNLTGSQEMVARARQQLMALLLNVASGKLALDEPVSEDGANVSQAVTYCDNLIDDPVGDHETAKSIADAVNNGKPVPAGWIPPDTPFIAYERPGVLIERKPELAQNRPNPFTGTTLIRFTLPGERPFRLTIYDVAGRQVRSISGLAEDGEGSVTWDGTDGRGLSVAPGLYFYRLEAGEFTRVKRMLRLR